MNGFHTLASRIKTIHERVLDKHKLCFDASVEVMLDYLVSEGTPVDTSQALSNWTVSLGKGSTVAIPAYFVGRKGSTLMASASAALSKGLPIIYQRKLRQPLFISNNLDYIEDLDDGKSSQSSNFTEISIGKFITNYKRMYSGRR